MSGDIGGGWPGPKESPKRARQLTRARVGWPPALRELKGLLYEVYLAAGAPSLDEIAEDIADDHGLDGAPSRDTVRRVITDGERPGQQADAVAVATVLARRAAWNVPDTAGRVRELWVQARMAQGVGRPIGDLRNDVRLVLDGGLGVHPALDTGGARDRFGLLPAYVPRGHDARLKEVVDAATAGRSEIAVLAGGSSTGKTRALWEAVRALPDGWRLWHPLTPTAPDAALAALPDIAPKTVVWLNEAQHYLGPDPLGEQVAAGLRKLLTDPSRAPVLVLGTLWPDHWDTLTTLDRHPGARALLSGHKIDVPKAFTPADLAALDATDDADPRLTQAAQHADDAQVTQYLAGVPYLMERYHAAEGATLALIHAAMDARRLGAGLHIPLAWLADAAPGYLTDTEYHALDDDWLSKALDYVTTPCNGIPGILTPVNTGGPRNQRKSRRPAPGPQGPHYLLADYLDQHGRHHRAESMPPIDFWTAAAHAHPADLTELGYAAWHRGLYRDAAQLHKNATTHGNPSTAAALVQRLHTLFPTDRGPARWAAAHAALDNPFYVAELLETLRKVGAHEQVAALLARNPAAHTALAPAYAVARLLRTLRKVGAHEQVAALLARDPAAHAAFDDPFSVAELLDTLRKVGAHEQVAALLARDPAAHTALDPLFEVDWLLKVLRKAEAHGQVTALAERAAAHSALDDPHVASVLRALLEVGADEQVTALAERAAAHSALDDPHAVAGLLGGLSRVKAHEQVAALLARDPAGHTALAPPHAVARLLDELRTVGAHEQVAALLARDPAAHVASDDAFAVTGLLHALLGAGAHEQATALAERAAAHSALDDAFTVGWLLDVLRTVGAHEQVAALLARDPAAHVSLDSATFAGLLDVLRTVGAHEQVAALLARNPAAHVSLDDPFAITRLLDVLRTVGAHEQVAALLARDPAAHVSLGPPNGVALLLDQLRKVGAHEQVTALVERLPPAGLCELFINHKGQREQFRFGREPDGTAAPSWTWNDLV